MGKIVQPGDGFRQMHELSKREIQTRLEFLQGAINGLVQTQKVTIGIVEKLCAVLEVNLDDLMNNTEVLQAEDGRLKLERKNNGSINVSDKEQATNIP